VRSGPGQPPALSQRGEPGASLCQINREKQQGYVRRNGAGADLLVVRPRGFANMTERSSGQPYPRSILFRYTHGTTGISCRNSFTPPRHGIICDKPKNNIMVSLWCMEKNSIAEMVKDPENFNTALVPCKGSDCPRWGEQGGCIMLCRVGKHGRE